MVYRRIGLFVGISQETNWRKMIRRFCTKKCYA